MPALTRLCHTMALATGRPVALESLTLAWLTQHALPRGRLLMRPAQDRRPARLVKVAAVRRLARQADVVMVVDDDPAVVAALVAAGFPAHLADWMTPDHGQPDLFEAQEVDGRT